MTATKMGDGSREAGRGSGERAERSKHLRRRWMMALGVAFGLTLSLTVRFTEAEDGGLFSGSAIPATVAILLTMLWIVGAGGGTWMMMRRADEHERAIDDWGLAMGARFTGIGYPVWLLLWKGRLAPEPDHVTLFLLFFAVCGTALIYRKWS